MEPSKIALGIKKHGIPLFNKTNPEKWVAFYKKIDKWFEANTVGCFCTYCKSFTFDDVVPQYSSSTTAVRTYPHHVWHRTEKYTRVVQVNLDPNFTNDQKKGRSGRWGSIPHHQ